MDELSKTDLKGTNDRSSDFSNDKTEKTKTVSQINKDVYVKSEENKPIEDKTEDEEKETQHRKKPVKKKTQQNNNKEIESRTKNAVKYKQNTHPTNAYVYI